MTLHMKLSARNTLEGIIVDILKGQTTSHIKLDIGHGNTITSSITNEAVDELGLRVGQTSWAVIKASDVLIAVN